MEESKYKHIKQVRNQGRLMWTVKFKDYGNPMFDEERDAAKQADIILIKKGLDPVNVLKKKK